jgi:hypothetical protein
MIYRGLGFLAVLYDSAHAHAHPLSPSSRRQLVSLSQSSCVKLTERRGGGVGVEPNHSLYLQRLAILSVMKTYPRVLKAYSGVIHPAEVNAVRTCPWLTLIKKMALFGAPM